MRLAISLPLITTILLSVSAPLQGAEPINVSDSLSLLMRLSERESSWDLMRGPYLDQVSLHHLRYSSSLSSFGVTYDGRHESRPLFVETGSGQHICQLSASAYLQPSLREHIWGQASYANGEKIDLKWNNVSDYSKLYPYILADRAGGNMRHETYSFGGGYSRQVARIRLSGELAYRSLQEFRTRDPRPRNIVSELNVSAALAYSFGGYDLGWSVGGEVYKQRSSISFYSPIGTETQYFLNGLGGSFARFNSNDPVLSYRGYAGSTSLLIAPGVVGHGFLGKLGYTFRTLEQILTDLNEVPINHSQVHDLELLLGYIFESSGSPLVWMVDMKSQIDTRIGIEHVVGESKAGTYPIEGYLRNFATINGKGRLALHISNGQDKGNAWQWYVQPSVGYQLHNLRKLAPSSLLIVRQWSGTLLGQLTYRLPKQQTLTLALQGEYAPKAQGELSLPYALIAQQHAEHQQHTFASLSSSHYGISIAPKYAFAIHTGSLPWGMEVGGRYSYTHYTPAVHTPIHQHQWQVSVHLIF